MDYKTIEGFENYAINKNGELINLITGFKLKAIENKCTGYKHFNLRREGKGNTRSVHRLVAETFLKKPKGKYEVNHIDGNKHNNELSNLEWVTRSENLKHAYKNKLHDECKLKERGIKAGEGAINNLGIKVRLLSPDGEVLKFRSLREACKTLGLDKKHLGLAYRDIDKQRKVKGYTIYR